MANNKMTKDHTMANNKMKKDNTMANNKQRKITQWPIIK